MSFFISKEFKVRCLDTADYWRCNDCGFVVSKTHTEMSPSDWETLNHDIHASYQGTDHDPRDPKWHARLQKQAHMLADAEEVGLLSKNDLWLDYACGDGKLSDLLRSRYDLKLLKYERYIDVGHSEGYVEDEALDPGAFNFVITTAVFEHLIRREQFDLVNDLVAKDGVLGLHTLVCEHVPADPTWFYLNPVHCACHTNRSMELLFQQWGYTSCVYHVDSQLWLWFKSDPQEVEATVIRANSRPGGLTYIFKRGFVDYWKCQPYRVD
ncbi:MAG: methyltransferase domain-containing protein [Candidatus Solibacter sp.]